MRCPGCRARGWDRALSDSAACPCERSPHARLPHLACPPHAASTTTPPSASLTCLLCGTRARRTRGEAPPLLLPPPLRAPALLLVLPRCCRRCSPIARHVPATSAAPGPLPRRPSLVSLLLQRGGCRQVRPELHWPGRLHWLHGEGCHRSHNQSLTQSITPSLSSFVHRLNSPYASGMHTFACLAASRDPQVWSAAPTSGC